MIPLLAIIRKDLQLFRTDRRAVLMQIAAPVVISAFFGFVFSRSTADAPKAKIAVLVVDEDGSSISHAVAEGLSSEAVLNVKAVPIDEARAEVRQGHAAVAVVLPAGFASAASSALSRAGAGKPEVPILYDPSHGAELALVRGLLTQHAMQAVTRRAFSAEALSLPYGVREEAVTAQKDVPYNGYAHAFAGMSVQFILFAGINMGIAVLLDKQRGVWKRLRAAPLSKTFVLGAKTASSALIAFLTLSIVFAFAVGVFGVRIEGSVVGFAGVLLSIALMTSTFGLLIASFGKTPDATRGISIFAVLIMVMLGGAWVPTFVFPAWLQRLTLGIPTRWAVDGIEAMTWRGLPFTSALTTMAALLGFSLLFGSLAVWRFDWEGE